MVSQKHAKGKIFTGNLTYICSWEGLGHLLSAISGKVQSITTHMTLVDISLDEYLYPTEGSNILSCHVSLWLKVSLLSCACRLRLAVSLIKILQKAPQNIIGFTCHRFEVGIYPSEARRHATANCLTLYEDVIPTKGSHFTTRNIIFPCISQGRRLGEIPKPHCMCSYFYSTNIAIFRLCLVKYNMSHVKITIFISILYRRWIEYRENNWRGQTHTSVHFFQHQSF